MSASFDVKMTKKILYDFLMTHTYRGFAGWFSIAMGLFGLFLTVSSIGKAEWTMILVYAVFSVYFLLYQPIALYMKAAKQIKLNPMYKEAIHYEVNDEGIGSSQNDQSVMIPWSDIIKVTESKYSFLLYTGKISSFVLPRESMGMQITIVEGLIRKHVKADQVKIK